MVYKEVKVMALRSKVTEPKFPADAHLSVMGSLQTQIGLVGINSLDRPVSTRFPTSKVTGPKVHGYAHLPLIGSSQA